MQKFQITFVSFLMQVPAPIFETLRFYNGNSVPQSSLSESQSKCQNNPGMIQNYYDCKFYQIKIGREKQTNFVLSIQITFLLQKRRKGQTCYQTANIPQVADILMELELNNLRHHQLQRFEVFLEDKMIFQGQRKLQV